MKKYFMKSTGKEVQFGDMIELELVKEGKHSSKYEHLEVKFTPLMAELLEEEGVVESKEVKNTVGINFDVEELVKDIKKDRLNELEDRLTVLEGIVAELQNK